MLKDHIDELESNSSAQSIKLMDVCNCISAMLAQEQSYLCHDYLNNTSSDLLRYNTNFEISPIDESCRSKMAQWCFNVVDCTNLHRDTVSIAMSYLDQFLCSSHHRAERARFNRKEYQLAAMTTLYIAVKVFEPFEMDASLVSKLSRGLYSAIEITRMEYEILVALSWRLSCPSPYQFCNYLLELLPVSAQEVSSKLYKLSHLQTELATGDYAYVPLRRSIIATASILNALEVFTLLELSIDKRIKFVEELSKLLDFNVCCPIVNAVRIRLLESFAKSCGYRLPQAGIVPLVNGAVASSSLEVLSNAGDSSETHFDCDKLGHCESPMCIAKEVAVSRRGGVTSSWERRSM